LRDSTRGVGMGEFRDLSSIVISGKILPWENSKIVLGNYYCYAGDYQELLDSTIINIDSATAQCFWIRNGSATNIREFIPSKPIVSQFELRTNTAQIIVETKSDCFARIPLSYYPDIKIYVNGVRCKEVYESADHFMIVRLDKGISKIDVVPTRSGIEKGSNLLSIICLTVIAGGLFNQRRKSKKN
jgi:hypothetical protein